MDEYIFNSLKFAYADLARAAVVSFPFPFSQAEGWWNGAPKYEGANRGTQISVNYYFSAKYQLTTIFLVNSQLTTNSD